MTSLFIDENNLRPQPVSQDKTTQTPFWSNFSRSLENFFIYENASNGCRHLIRGNEVSLFGILFDPMQTFIE